MMARTPTNVCDMVAPLFDRRRQKEAEMLDECTAGMIWFDRTVASIKLKILESAGVADPGPVAKKAKVCRDSQKENAHPNVLGTVHEELKPPTDPVTGNDDGHHPDDDLDLDGMKVAELRSELRSRELGTGGLKKELQKRLADAIEAGRADRERKRLERARRAEEKAREEEERRTVAREERWDHPEGGAEGGAEKEPTEAAAVEAMDFPGVNVAVLETVKDKNDGDKPSGSGGNEMEVETAVVSNDRSASADEEMEDAAGQARGKHIDIVDLCNESFCCNEEESMLTEPVAPTTTETTSLQGESDVDMMSPESKSPKKRNLGQKIIKVTSKLFSPPSGKKNKSPLKTGKSPIKQDKWGKPPAKQETQEEDDMVDLPPPPPPTSALKEPPAAAFNQDFSKPELAKKAYESMSSSNASSLPKIPAVCTKPKKGDSNSSTESKSTSSASSKCAEAKKKAEARRARLAEMRGKSKPVELTESQKAKLGKADPSALRKVKAAKGTFKSKSATTKESQQRSCADGAGSASIAAELAKKEMTPQDKQKEKRAQLAAQMREKAKAAKAQKGAGPKQNEQRPITPALQEAQENPAQKAQPKLQQQAHPKPQQLRMPPQQPQVPPQQLQVPLQQLQMPPQRLQVPPKQPVTPQAPKAAQSPRKGPQQEHQPMVLSPMDTYEISDHEDSDSEDDYSDSEDDEKKPKKKIPKWALRSNLIPALEQQFMDGPDRVDPDEIFPEVSTCDLSSVFDQKKSRYQKRTSSGNWTKDKVTVAEKLVYKRTMGFAK